MDRVRARFGREALGYAAVVFREGGGVPDEFRELAEADRDGARQRHREPPSTTGPLPGVRRVGK